MSDDRNGGAPSERFGLGVSNCRPVAEVIAAVRRAEELGAEIAFIAEDVNCRDAFQLCALSASSTTRIRLATGVVNPYTRNPTSLAMAAATLDEISAGRAVLGLGTSSPSLVDDQMGIPTGKPVRVMREATEIVRALLAGLPFSYQGQHFRYVDAHLEAIPVQRHLPIFYAAMGPLMLRLAGHLADGVLLNVGASTEYVRWAVAQIRASMSETGRAAEQFTVAAWLSAYVTDDYDSAMQRAREWLATMLAIPRQGEILLEQSGIDTSILEGIRAHFSAYPHRGDRAAAARYVPPDIVERLVLIGDAGKVRNRVQEYRAAGVDLPVLSPAALRVLLQK
jgi:5,10-methylenetetrahydromethanopterin reductase